MTTPLICLRYVGFCGHNVVGVVPDKGSNPYADGWRPWVECNSVADAIAEVNAHGGGRVYVRRYLKNGKARWVRVS